MTQQPFDPTQAPSHPDYIRMVELVSEMETQIDADFNIKDYLAQYADPESVGYLALQRAIGSIEMATPQDLIAAMPDVMRLSLLYTEGFILGVQFEQTQTSEDRALAAVIREAQADDDEDHG